MNSNGSGNTLSLLYSVGEGETQVLPLATLDVSGWKQVSVNGLPAGTLLEGAGRGICRPGTENL